MQPGHAAGVTGHCVMGRRRASGRRGCWVTGRGGRGRRSGIGCWVMAWRAAGSRSRANLVVHFASAAGTKHDREFEAGSDPSKNETALQYAASHDGPVRP